jgi:MFS family permease
MFTALLQIKNYKLFVVNMLLLGMGIAVTVPYLILFATKDLGMTTTQYGLLLALAAISQFIVNSIIARFSDTHHLNRKILKFFFKRFVIPWQRHTIVALLVQINLETAHIAR